MTGEGVQGGWAGFRSEFNSTALAELRFHCAAEFCVCLAIFWLTWPTSGTPAFLSLHHALHGRRAARRSDEDRWRTTDAPFDLSFATRAGFPR